MVRTLASPTYSQETGRTRSVLWAVWSRQKLGSILPGGIRIYPGSSRPVPLTLSEFRTCFILGMTVLNSEVWSCLVDTCRLGIRGTKTDLCEYSFHGRCKTMWGFDAWYARESWYYTVEFPSFWKVVEDFPTRHRHRCPWLIQENARLEDNLKTTEAWKYGNDYGEAHH